MKVKRILTKTLLWGILTVFLLWSAVPIYLVLTNAFKTALDIKEMPPKWIFEPTLIHFKRILSDGGFGSYFMNSSIIAISTTVISVIGGAFGAYGLILSSGKWALRASNFMLIGKLVPAIAILIPFYTILEAVGLNGSYIGPILAHSSINLPFVVWLMLSFMSDIPKSLFESSRIDGATRMQTFWKIIFPIMAPAIGSAVILSMQYSWNELVYSLQLTSMESYTLPVGIGRFVGSVSVDWGKSSAAASMTMVPIIIVGFMMQRHLVSGLSAGAVKG